MTDWLNWAGLKQQEYESLQSCSELQIILQNIISALPTVLRAGSYAIWGALDAVF